VNLTAKLVVGGLVVAGLFIAAIYAPSDKVGEVTGTVTISSSRTVPKDRKIYRLEVELPDGTRTPVRADTMPPAEGNTITVEKHRSWVGYTYYVWRS